jgi:hypothetical protein
MNILTLLLVLVLIGVLIWAVTTYIPMDPGIKTLIRIVGVVLAVVYVLSAFGVFHGLSSVNVPQVH